MDGKTEDKTFGPGYGEFYTADGADVEALALSGSADAAGGPLPAELVTLEQGADSIFGSAASKYWGAASSHDLRRLQRDPGDPRRDAREHARSQGGPARRAHPLYARDQRRLLFIPSAERLAAFGGDQRTGDVPQGD